jgi:hypothetical protein
MRPAARCLIVCAIGVLPLCAVSDDTVANLASTGEVWTFNPRLFTGVGYDSNPAAQATSRGETSWRGGAGLRIGWNIAEGEQAVADAQYQLSLRTPGTPVHALQGSLDWTHNDGVRRRNAGVSAARDLSRESDSGERLIVRTLTARAGAGRSWYRWSVDGGLRATATRSQRDADTPTTDRRDTDDAAASIEIGYLADDDANELTSISEAIVIEAREADQGGEWGWAQRAGWRHRLDDRRTSRAELGVEYRQYRARENDAGQRLELNRQWAPSALVGLTVAMSDEGEVDVEATSGLTTSRENNPAWRLGGSATYRRALSERVSGRVGLGGNRTLERDAPEGLPLEQRVTWSASAGLGFAQRPGVTWSATAQVSRSSAERGADYDRLDLDAGVRIVF